MKVLVFVIFIAVGLPVSSGIFRLNLDSIQRRLWTMTGIDPAQVIFSLITGKHVVTDPKMPEPLPFPMALKQPPISEAEHYVHFAAASYCHGIVLTRWTCRECKLTGHSTRLVKVVDIGNSLGYVALDLFRKEIILVFRGSNNPTNIIEDGTIELIDSPIGDEDVKLHKGFVDAVMLVYPQLFQIVRKQVAKHPGWRVVITGHSLGAAEAVLAYYLMSYKMPKVNYALFTYGEPRNGNKAFADLINARNIPYARVINEGDPVPHGVPTSEGYYHHGTEYWTHNGRTRICSNQFYEDFTCSQSIGVYIATQHLTYFRTSIGLNCVEENPLVSLRAMAIGK